jgi:hypothetical protein
MYRQCVIATFVALGLPLSRLARGELSVRAFYFTSIGISRSRLLVASFFVVAGNVYKFAIDSCED